MIHRFFRASTIIKAVTPKKWLKNRAREIAKGNGQLQTLNKILEGPSYTDTLTGLKNRRHLRNISGWEVAFADRRVK